MQAAWKTRVTRGLVHIGILQSINLSTAFNVCPVMYLPDPFALVGAFYNSNARALKGLGPMLRRRWTGASYPTWGQPLIPVRRTRASSLLRWLLVTSGPLSLGHFPEAGTAALAIA